MNPKIFVTAFKPFLHHTQNASEIVLQELQKERSDIETLLLPVSFQKAFPEFKKHWQSKGPYKAVVMLGQAAGQKEVKLERVALNWMESRYADNDGLSPSGKRILREGPDSYIVDFFPSSWLEILDRLGPTKTSFSAGAYVCNHLYFQVVHELKSQGVPPLFVHLPLLPEQTQDGLEQGQRQEQEQENQGQVVGGRRGGGGAGIGGGAGTGERAILENFVPEKPASMPLETQKQILNELLNLMGTL